MFLLISHLNLMVQCHQRQSKNEFRQHLLPTENELLPGWRHTRILCVGKRHSRIWAQTRQLTHKSNSSQLPVKKKKKKTWKLSLLYRWTNTNLSHLPSHLTWGTSKTPAVCLWMFCPRTSSRSLTWQRPLHLFRLINLSFAMFCYSAHAQPLPVTYTLLAYAKC